MNGLEQLLLRANGMSQATIDEIEKALPTAAELLKLVRDNQILIGRIVALANEAQPLLAQAMPLVDKAVAEINAILPAAQDLVAFLQKANETLPVNPPSQWPSGDVA